MFIPYMTSISFCRPCSLSLQAGQIEYNNWEYDVIVSFQLGPEIFC